MAVDELVSNLDASAAVMLLMTVLSGVLTEKQSVGLNNLNCKRSFVYWLVTLAEQGKVMNTVEHCVEYFVCMYICALKVVIFLNS